MKQELYTLKGYENYPMAIDVTLPEGNAPRGIALWAHGINGFKDWGGMPIIAEQFAQANLVFVKFNFSHNGTTPDFPDEIVDKESYGNDNYRIRQHDLQCVIEWCAKKAPEWGVPEKRVHLIGHSRGGTDAILFASANGTTLRSLTTWAAVAEATTPWRGFSEKEMESWREKGVFYRKHGRTGQDLPIYYQLYEEYQQHKQRLNVEQAAREVKVPWLIVHGEDDPAVFVKNAYDLKAYQPEAEVKIIPQADHVFNRSHPWREKTLPEATEKLVEANIDFIQRQH